MATEKVKIFFDGDLAALKSELDKLGADSRTRGRKSGEEWGDEFLGGFKEIFAGMTLANLTTSAVQGAIGGIKALFEDVFARQDTLADFSALTGIAGEQLDVFAASAERLSSKFGTSVLENVDAFKGLLSRLGPDIATSSEALEIMADNVNTLAVASGLDATASMDALTTAMLQFGVSLDDPLEAANTMTDMMNIMAAGAKEGAAEIPDLSESLKQVGTTAAQLGLEFGETTAAIEVLAQGGKRGSEAGVALRNVLTSLVSATGPGEDALKAIGLSTEQLGRTLTEQGIGATMQLFNEHMGRVSSSATRAAIQVAIFGKENLAGAGVMLKNADMIQMLNAKILNTQTASEQAGVKMGTFNAQVSIAGEAIKNKLAGALEAALPLLTGIVSNLTRAMPVIEGVTTVLLAGAAAYAVYTAATHLGAIASAVASSAFTKMALAMVTNPFFLVAGAIAATVVIMRQQSEAARHLAQDQAAATNAAIAANRAEIKVMETRRAELQSVQTAMRVYEELGAKTKLSAEEHRKLGTAISTIERQFPGAIKAGDDYAANLGRIKNAAKQTDEELGKISQNIENLSKQQRDLLLDRELDKVKVKAEEFNNTILDGVDAWYKLGGMARREAYQVTQDILRGITTMGTTDEAVTQGTLRAFEKINALDGLSVAQKSKLKDKIDEIAQAQRAANKAQEEYGLRYNGKVNLPEEKKDKPGTGTDVSLKTKKEKEEKDARLLQLAEEKRFALELMRIKGRAESDILQVELDYDKLELARMQEISAKKEDLIKKQGEVQITELKKFAAISEEALNRTSERIQAEIARWNPESLLPDTIQGPTVDFGNIDEIDVFVSKLSNLEEWSETAGSAITTLAGGLGNVFATKDPEKQADAWKQMGKSILSTVITTVQGIVLAAAAGSAAQGVLTFGISTIKDAPLLAAAYVALELAKGFVNSLDVGGVIKEDQFIRAHADETIIPFDKAPAFFAEAVNQGAGNPASKEKPPYRPRPYESARQLTVANDEWFRTGRVHGIRSVKNSGA